MKFLLFISVFSISICAQYDFHDLITIEQTGNGNRCLASNEHSEGLNISNIIQVGNYNGTAFDMTGDGVSDPTMIIRTAPNCEASIEEYGNYNSALIQQNMDANTLGEICQNGNYNLAILRQGYCTKGSLIQEGNWNRADANQICSEARLTSIQNGNRNSFSSEQKIDSDLESSQNGNKNEATFHIDVFAAGKSIQDGYANHVDAVLFAEHNSFSAQQTGDNNYLSIYEDFESQVEASQDGNGNEAVIIMDYNVIKLKQVGNNNYSDQSQGIGHLPEGVVCQVGNNNSAYQSRWGNCTGDIQQLSDGNYAHQNQYTEIGQSARNYAQIVQTGGYNNYAVQMQKGSGLSSIIMQHGSNNNAESYQTDLIY